MYTLEAFIIKMSLVTNENYFYIQEKLKIIYFFNKPKKENVESYTGMEIY